MTYVPRYVQVYRMFESGVPVHEIARRIYGVIDERKLGSIRKLISYARKKLGRERTFSQSLYGETFPAHSPVFDPRTSSYVDPESGLVLDEKLPYYEFKEEFLSHASPAPSSLTSLGTIFYSKRLGRIQADPPGALGDERLIKVNNGLEELSRILGLLGVPGDSVVREAAARLLRANIDLFSIVEAAVSAALVSIAAFRPGDIGRVFDIAESYGVSRNHLVSLVMRMKIPSRLIHKAFYGLLEFLAKNS